MVSTHQVRTLEKPRRKEPAMQIGFLSKVDVEINEIKSHFAPEKVQIFRSKENSTTVAFLSHLSIPNASKFYTNDGYGTLNRILISHDIFKTLSLGYNLGYNKIFGNPGAFIYTLALAKSIGSWGIYAELFGENSKKESPNSYDLGLTYLLKGNVQFDVSLGKGFNNKMDYFAVGLSWNYDLSKSK